jgi:octaprenyl-diphosphate synthase
MTAVLTNGKAASRPLPFAPIAADLAAAEQVLTAALAGYRSPVAPLVDHLKHYRGKRLRPALLLLAAKACGGVGTAHHTLAAAVEMIHTATLVHDDVLDEADLRRHAPTVNAEWGAKVAVLLGDTLFTHAFHLASTIDGRACRIIGEATNRVCGGELRQVCERGNLHLTAADYFAIIDGKTAALTECCGRLGALYAGASADVAERLAGYGRNLGLAFQVADDLLDLTGDEATAGKTLGTDLDQRKLTLPLIHCLTELPPGDAGELRAILQAGEAATSARVAAALERTASLEFARRTADEFARAARHELRCLPASECRSILEALADWSVRREQ